MSGAAPRACAYRPSRSHRCSMASIDDQSVVPNRMSDICISPQKTFPVIFDSYADRVGHCLHANRKQVKGSIRTFSPMTHFHLLRWRFVLPS
jgi:hypothetical protein